MQLIHLCNLTFARRLGFQRRNGSFDANLMAHRHDDGDELEDDSQSIQCPIDRSDVRFKLIYA
jgi:hypothetical protein